MFFSLTGVETTGELSTYPAGFQLQRKLADASAVP